MNRANTSRARFREFVERFKSRQLDDSTANGDQEASDQLDGATKRPDREKRRDYLRNYASRLWPYWRTSVLLIVLSLVIAGLEIVQPLFFRYVMDNLLLSDALEPPAKLNGLLFIGTICLALVIVSQLLAIWKNYRQYLLNIRVMLGLRRALYDRLLRLPLDKLSEMKTGGIISRLTDDVNTTSGLMQMAIISPGVAGLRLLLSVAVLFAINWKLALTAIAFIPFVVAISLIAARRIRPIYRQVRKEVSHVDGRVGEAFQGIRAVRAFLGEHREEHEYTVGHNAIMRMKTMARWRELVLLTSWGFLMSAILPAIIFVGGYFYVYGTATIGDILAFQIYTFMLLNPVWQIVQSYSELQRSLAAMERVFEVLDMEEDKPDVPGALAAPREVETIEFRDVWFAYDDENHVLKNINLSVAGGTVVALVGRSGAGKTTMTDLVARFYDPTRGGIYLNGLDLRQLKLNSFRELLGVVQQDVFLFDGSVRENIAYANRGATIDEIRDAAQRANAHEFIEKLPEQYETVIGERGVKLSGGQRQRLSIARAILADPRILILDEATSNLDTESEQLIQQSLEELVRDRTTFIIAHRLSTIAHADQIVVMEGGEIVETGRHSELVDRRGLYADMVDRQHGAITL